MEIFTGILLGILLYFPGGARLCDKGEKWACQYKQKIEAPVQETKPEETKE